MGFSGHGCDNSVVSASPSAGGRFGVEPYTTEEAGELAPDEVADRLDRPYGGAGGPTSGLRPGAHSAARPLGPTQPPSRRYRPAMALELVPLFTCTVTLAPTISVSSSLVIGEVTGAVVDGDRITAHMKGAAAADWLRVSPEGYGTLDVKITYETDDGALVHATYSGRLLFDTMTVYAAPLFHTGDERYAWLNRIQAAAKGTFQPDGTLVYEVYELR